MRFVGIWLVTLVTAGCLFTAPAVEVTGHGGSVRLIDHGFLTVHFTELEYWSPTALAAKSLQDREFSAEDREHANEPVPPGGSLWVRLVRPELDHANPKYYKVIIKNGNRDLMRVYGRHTIPQVYGDVWRGLIVIPLPADLPDRFQVHVIDPICDQQNVYEVSRNL